MKKIKTIFPALAFGLCLSGMVSSCSDSEEDGPAVPAAKSVEGTYNGDMVCSVMGNESVFEDMTVTIDATDESSVSVTVSPFGSAPMAVPALEINGVPVSGEDGVYTLASTEFSGTTESGKAYSGTLQGNYEEDEMTVRFNLLYGAMPMPMICTFTAPKN